MPQLLLQGRWLSNVLLLPLMRRTTTSLWTFCDHLLRLQLSSSLLGRRWYHRRLLCCLLQRFLGQRVRAVTGPSLELRIPLSPCCGHLPRPCRGPVPAAAVGARAPSWHRPSELPAPRLPPSWQRCPLDVLLATFTGLPLDGSGSFCVVVFRTDFLTGFFMRLLHVLYLYSDDFPTPGNGNTTLCARIQPSERGRAHALEKMIWAR